MAEEVISHLAPDNANYLLTILPSDAEIKRTFLSLSKDISLDHSTLMALVHLSFNFFFKIVANDVMKVIELANQQGETRVEQPMN